MVKMTINGKSVIMTIDKMICKDCAYRFKNKGALQILNCQKYPFGKPYHPNLTKNKCKSYISEDEGVEIETSYKKMKRLKKEKKKKLKEKYKH